MDLREREREREREGEREKGGRKTDRGARGGSLATVREKKRAFFDGIPRCFPYLRTPIPSRSASRGWLLSAGVWIGIIVTIWRSRLLDAAASRARG
jgi:hypothetical protein